jgi:hypothetical protein
MPAVHSKHKEFRLNDDDTIAYFRSLAKDEQTPVTFDDPSRKKHQQRMSKSKDSDSSIEKNYINIKVPFDLENTEDKDNSYEQRLFLFKGDNASSEDYIIWCEALAEFNEKLGYQKEPMKQLKLLQSTLAGDAKEKYEAAYKTIMERDAYSAHKTDKEVFLKGLRHVLNEFARNYFANPDDAVIVQKRYLRSRIHMSDRQNPRKVITRCLQMNRGIPWYPLSDKKFIKKGPAKPLGDPEMIDLAYMARTNAAKVKMMLQGHHGDFDTLDEAETYYEDLWNGINLEKKHIEEMNKSTRWNQVDSRNNKKSGKRKSSDSTSSNKSNKNNTANAVCGYCKKPNHTIEQCHKKKSDERNKRAKYNKGTEAREISNAQLMEQMNQMQKCVAALQESNKERKSKRKPTQAASSYLTAMDNLAISEAEESSGLDDSERSNQTSSSSGSSSSESSSGSSTSASSNTSEYSSNSQF